MKKTAAILMLILGWGPAIADTSIPLRVTATIPPKSCDVGDPCESAVKPVAASETRVIVRADRITYVGSRPSVEVKDGARILLF